MRNLLACSILAMSACLAGDLANPNVEGIAWGHFHFTNRDMDAVQKFWTALGATPSKPLGNQAVYKVKNALIVVRKGEPLGGTEATIVNHVGFKVKDLDGTLAAAKAAGFKLLTPPETTAKSHKGNVMGPDDINIELVGDPSLDVPIASHHVHFFDGDVEKTRDWYVKTFSAIPGKRDIFEAADLPGINLSFSAAKGAVKGTKGYALDHIGFDVWNLEAFCKHLEDIGVKFDRPFTKVPALGINIAFFTDPFGTYIELTEGLGKMK